MSHTIMPFYQVIQRDYEALIFAGYATRLGNAYHTLESPDGTQMKITFRRPNQISTCVYLVHLFESAMNHANNNHESHRGIEGLLTDPVTGLPLVTHHIH